MTVTLPDGTELKLEAGATGADAARAIGEGLARAALGVRRNGSATEDLSAPLDDGDQIEIVTARTPEDDRLGPLWLVRHDAAHVLATAVMELYPGVKISMTAVASTCAASWRTSQSGPDRKSTRLNSSHPSTSY